jgi:hypothetical protein
MDEMETAHDQGRAFGETYSKLKFKPPALRVEMADFIGEATIAPCHCACCTHRPRTDAEAAEKEFLRMKKADRSSRKWDKYHFNQICGNKTQLIEKF